jgi:hypothetical protein
MNRWQLFFGHTYTDDFKHQMLARMLFVAPFFASASYSLGAYLHRANVFGFKVHEEQAAQGDNA